jgi:hypothetical protein
VTPPDSSRGSLNLLCAGYGIQNGTSAVPKADGKAPDCVHTLQCELLNIQTCKTIGSDFCNWTVIPFDNGTLCAPTKGGPIAGGIVHL